MQGSIKKYVGTTGKVSWVATVDLPRHPITGKRRQKRVTAPTKREAESQAAQLIASIDGGGFTEADAKRVTVRDYLTKWLESNAQTVRPSTQRRYKDLINKHVIPIVGHLALSKLAPLDIQRLYTDRLSTGKLSPTTVAQIHNIIHKALKQAVRWGMLTRNVTEAVDRPRPARTQYVVWTHAQAAAFLAVADLDEYAALWRLTLLTGMRRGEVLGLKWGASDLIRGSLAVKETIIRAADGGSFEFGEPKTAAGRRSIALPRSVVEALKRHKVKQNESRLQFDSPYIDLDLVFATADGSPLHPNSLALRFNRLCDKAKVPRIRFHDLRHTSATLMLANGEHPKIVQERLGHSDVSMTLNRYSHVSMDMQRGAADRMDDLMSAK